MRKATIESVREWIRITVRDSLGAGVAAITLGRASSQTQSDAELRSIVLRVVVSVIENIHKAADHSEKKDMKFHAAVMRNTAQYLELSYGISAMTDEEIRRLHGIE